MKVSLRWLRRARAAMLGLFQQVGNLRGVATRAMMRCARRRGNLIEKHQREGSLTQLQARLELLDGHEVVAEHQFHGTVRSRSCWILKFFEVDNSAIGWQGSAESVVGPFALELRVQKLLCHAFYLRPPPARHASEKMAVERDEDNHKTIP